jgi:tRNA G10  N-methylase Trm11
MEKFIFVIGRNPALSIAELEAYFTSRNISFKIFMQNNLAIVAKTGSFSSKEAIKRLGGTLKIGRVIDNFDNLYLGTKNKVRYGISNYDDADLSQLHADLKAYFKSEKLKAMLKKSQARLPYLSPKESLNVVELLQLGGYFARTEAVFDGKQLEYIDSNRPENELKNSTPIRLSRMMLNLAGVSEKTKVLNPFATTGTITQEALLIGAEVYVSDPRPENLDVTKTNLEWVKKQFNPKGIYIVKRNFNGLKGRDFVTVSEPPMGPFFKYLLHPEQAKNVSKTIYTNYKDLLEEVYSLSKCIVLVTPIFRLRNEKEYRFQFERLLERHKFNSVKSFRYDSPGSKIIREIWVLER